MEISEKILKTGKNPKADARTQKELLKRSGVDLIEMDIGEPNFTTPDFIIEEAYHAMKAGFTHYTPVEGYLSLRESICEKLKKENNISYLPEEILVSSGAKQSISNALFALLNDGDEVLIPIPCWDSYPNMVRLAGGVPVLVELDENNRFEPVLERFQEQITDKTKAIILNNPHNPTGRVYSQNLIKKICRLAMDYGLYIISDEIYEYLLYGGDLVSPAAIDEEVKRHTVTINGLSKSFAMTGWRIGYAAGPREIISAMKTFQSYTTSNSSSVTQKASEAAVKAGKICAQNMVSEFAERRLFIMKGLREIGINDFYEPEGAFYIFPDISKYIGCRNKDTVITNADVFCRFILESANVSISSGS